MKKRSAHLIILLLLMGTSAFSALPGPATLDSLLTLPRPEKYELIRKVLKESNLEKTGDIYAKLEFVKELTHFFISKGSPNDVLLLEIACFTSGTCYPLNEHQTLHWGNAILKEAASQKDTLAMAAILGALGTYHYKYRNDHVKSFECLWIVNQLIKTLGPERYPGYEYSVYYLARSHYDFFDYENAIRYGSPLMQVAPDEVTATHIFNTCLLGMSYYYLHKPAEARKYFWWGLRFVPTVFKDSPVRKDIGWTGIFYGDIGLTYYEEGAFDRALPYLEKGFELTTQTQYWNNVPVFGAKLARIRLAENQLSEAKRYAYLSIEATHKVDATIYPRCRYSAEPYQVMSEYYRRINSPSLALAYADSARQAEAQWKQIFSTSQKHQSEIALAREEFLAREQKAQVEKANLVRLRNGLLIAALLGSVLVILLFLLQWQRLRGRRKQLETEKRLASTELEKVRMQLNRALQSVGREEHLEEQSLATPASLPQPAVLWELQQSVILTEDDWTHFVALFEKVHPGFFARLRLRFPDLTPAETRFLALSRLDYTNREMAAMLGVGLGAIRQYRMRLRRKLNLSDYQEIEEMASAV